MPTHTVDVVGTDFAYRDLGAGSDVPVIFLHHFTAVLDDWDPRVIDGIAAERRIIAFDNRGVRPGAHSCRRSEPPGRATPTISRSSPSPSSSRTATTT